MKFCLIWVLNITKIQINKDNMLILILIIYVIGFILFCLWDAFIGFGNIVEFDGYDAPPVFLVAWFWFIAVPVLLLFAFFDVLCSIKHSRKERAKLKRKMRVDAEEQARKILEEAEREMEEFLKNDKRTTIKSG